MLKLLRRICLKLKDNIRDYSCANIIRLISIMPRLGGFPLMTNKIFVLFWVIHIFLATYVYLVGVIFYQMYFSAGLIDSISSVFNILVVIVVFNNSFWFLVKKREINDLLKLAVENDTLVIEEGRFLDTYRNLMMKTKMIVLTCYSFHFINDILVFIPSRIFDMPSFSIVSCVGLEPLSVSPNREACMLILAGQELTSSLVVAGYDVIILFLFSHTTAIFLILCMDMEHFSEITKQFDGSIKMQEAIDTRLRNLIQRHSLVLLTVNKLQRLFSIAIGVVLILNTISLCTFFVLPLESASSFAPLIYYTLTVFFLYCLLGQRLINASEGFEMAVYCCGWERLDLRRQRVILLMLIQAQRPVTLHAADMVPICMATFTNTLQAIYRFVTVFRI